MEVIKIDAPKDTCKTCVYFNRQIDPKNITLVSGTCRRYPPVPFPLPAPGGQIAVASVRPNVDGGDTCGEYMTPFG